MGKKITTAEWVAKAKEVHGDKYDYSKAEYIKASIKICIICPKHGEFFQRSDHHLSGHGCSKCASEERGLQRIQNNSANIIEKIKNIYGDKYDYSKVVYNGYNNKITLICKEHGEFNISAASALVGTEELCPYCAKGSKSIDTNVFIYKAKEIHGDKYDYSKVVYKTAKTKVCIICPRCGEFWQTPDSHLNKKSGCPICMNAMTTEEFIDKARKVHGDKYDYSKTQYNRSFEKVCVICPKHGEFWQTPNTHLVGKGCPQCGYESLLSKDISDGEQSIINILNKWNIKYEPQFPIFSKINISGWLYVDFYLPEYNTFIEYNGEQHYIPIECMGGQLQFERQQARDKELRQYCKDNNINLIEIRYDEDVWEVLNEKLCR
jgi:hypothetical protein